MFAEADRVAFDDMLEEFVVNEDEDMDESEENMGEDAEPEEDDPEEDEDDGI